MIKPALNAKTFFYGQLGLIFIFGAILAAGTYYGNGLLAAKAKKIQEIHADIDLVQEKKAETAKLQKKIDTLADVKDLALKVLPKDKDQASLLAQIYDIAKGFNISLSDISFSSSSKGPSSTSQTEELKDAKSVRVYPLTTGIECVSYPTFLSFLERLEVNRRKAQISSLSIQPIVNKAGEVSTCPNGNISVNDLRIEVYLKNETASPTTTQKN